MYVKRNRVKGGIRVREVSSVKGEGERVIAYVKRSREKGERVVYVREVILGKGGKQRKAICIS